MTTRRSRALAVGLVVVSAALVLLGTVVAIASPEETHNATAWDVISFAAPVAAFSIVGGLIATRRPENAIGWLLATIGLLFATVLACSAVAQWGLAAGAIPKSVGEWIGVGANVWVLALGLIGIQLPLRLPGGRLPSPRWRWFSRASIVVMAVTLTGMATQRGRIEDVSGTANPLGTSLTEPLAGAVFLMIAGFVVGVAALFMRYRHADELDRVQLRWVALGGGLFLAVYLVTLPLPSALGANPPSRRCRSRSATRSCATGSTTSTSSSTVRSSTARSQPSWPAFTWAACCCSSCSWAESRATRASPSPARRSRSPRCSARPEPASRQRSTGASSGASTTPSGRSRSSRRACATRSICER
jgi:hypothetical protein